MAVPFRAFVIGRGKVRGRDNTRHGWLICGTKYIAHLPNKQDITHLQGTSQKDVKVAIGRIRVVDKKNLNLVSSNWLAACVKQDGQCINESLEGMEIWVLYYARTLVSFDGCVG